MNKTRQSALKIRHERIRRKVRGTPARPRLCFHKSARHLYILIVDDLAGRTLLAATTNSKSNKAQAKSFCNAAWAKKVGLEVGQKALSQGVKSVVFDRGGYRYHGVVKAFADAAREAGLQF
ncbi:50S ribosomal protein L18 [Candidatus Sumerlaeota bacterium]|nr:50S ribosomal protein L18 [Candidatus Sumerlaeota bacterium]MBI3735146.1 50S ribosomal protein L18 [Candidatus Sumerlaeota bacterium]